MLFRSAVIDSATSTTLFTNPNDAAAGAKAVGEIVAALHITPAQAVARLAELKTIPVSQLLVLQSSGTKVVQAGAALTALSKVPAADLAFLNTYGTALQDAKVQAALRYLQTNAPSVQSAAKHSPGQWRDYFWIAVGGEIAFIPLVFVMAGYWDPRRARRYEREHEAWLEAELAKL